ncbi:MAG: hypothetical protein R3C01_13155 [Planctomycetaceae bacterium]
MLKRPKSGGWKAIWYSLRLARRVGWWKMRKAMRGKNTCKTRRSAWVVNLAGW